MAYETRRHKRRTPFQQSIFRKNNVLSVFKHVMFKSLIITLIETLLSEFLSSGIQCFVSLKVRPQWSWATKVMFIFYSDG